MAKKIYAKLEIEEDTLLEAYEMMLRDLDALHEKYKRFLDVQKGLMSEKFAIPLKEKSDPAANEAADQSQ